MVGHFEFTRINIEPTILRKKIEDLREAGATLLKRCGVTQDLFGTRTSASWTEIIVGCTLRTNRQETPATSQESSARQNFS